jgi:hypothetical protein
MSSTRGFRKSKPNFVLIVVLSNQVKEFCVITYVHKLLSNEVADIVDIGGEWVHEGVFIVLKFWYRFVAPKNGYSRGLASRGSN